MGWAFYLTMLCRTLLVGRSKGFCDNWRERSIGFALMCVDIPEDVIGYISEDSLVIANLLAQHCHCGGASSALYGSGYDALVEGLQGHFCPFCEALKGLWESFRKHPLPRICQLLQDWLDPE
jgi:hypothetical protein